MNKNQNRLKMGRLMALLLFVIFAVCILAVLLTGADVYKRMVERDRISYNQRTAASFLATKVRQADRMDSIQVLEHEGRDVLVIGEDIEGSRYETWIYCYDGYLRELFAAAGSGLDLEAGDKVLEARELRIWWQEPMADAPDGGPGNAREGDASAVYPGNAQAADVPADVPGNAQAADVPADVPGNAQETDVLAIDPGNAQEAEAPAVSQRNAQEADASAVYPGNAQEEDAPAVSQRNAQTADASAVSHGRSLHAEITTPDGGTQSLTLKLRSGEEVRP